MPTSKSKLDADAGAADGGSVTGFEMADMLIEMQDQFSIGERLRLAAAIIDAALKERVGERARLGKLRAQQIVDAVARDLRREPT